MAKGHLGAHHLKTHQAPTVRLGQWFAYATAHLTSKSRDGPSDRCAVEGDAKREHAPQGPHPERSLSLRKRGSKDEVRAICLQFSTISIADKYYFNVKRASSDINVCWESDLWVQKYQISIARCCQYWGC